MGAFSQNFDTQSTLRIQQALNRLGYPAGAADGQWGRRTGQAVRQYRFDFLMSDRAALSVPEANELLNRATWLDDPTILILADNWLNGAPTKELARQGASYEPQELLFATERHLLAMKLLTRTWNTQPSAVPYDLSEEWLASKRQRARVWLQEDLNRISNRTDDVGHLLVAFLKFDLALTYSGLRATREDVLRDVLPVLDDAYVRSNPDRLNDTLARHVIERLMRDLGPALGALSCSASGTIEKRWVDLARNIVNRFSTYHPSSAHVYGYALEIAKCADFETAQEILSWRMDVAKRSNDPAFEMEATLAMAAEMFERGEFEKSRNLYTTLLGEQPKEVSDEIIRDHLHRLIDLGERVFVGSYLLEKLESLRGESIHSTAALGTARYLGTSLLEIGYGLEIVDRIFYETDNQWRNGSQWRKAGSIYDFYHILIRSMINDGDGSSALAPLVALIERAENDHDIDAAESFREQELFILLSQGRYSAAEDRISAFIEKARLGANDPRVAAWQSQLNLSRLEGGAPGRVFAEQFGTYLDTVCQPNPPENAHDLQPVLDRDTVYADPEFSVAALELGLSTKIMQCRGKEWLTESLSRIGCYLWAKEDDIPRVHLGMQRWWQTQSSRVNEGGLAFEAVKGVNCPMGIAEAGRSDLILQYAAQVPEDTWSIGLQLLRLAGGLHLTGVQPHMLDHIAPARLDTASSYPLLELAGRMDHSSRKAFRAALFSDFEYTWSGAAMDNAEWARIRAMGFDIARGYAALNLNEIALMFVEGAAFAVGTAVSEEKAQEILDDEELLRLAIARGQLALKMGDTSTAHQISAPIVSAYIARVRAGRAGSVEELASWAQRLMGLAELYLSTLATNPDLLAAEPIGAVLDAQQLLAAASASASSGRLAARLASADPEMARAYQDAVMDFRGAIVAASRGGDAARVSVLREKVKTLRDDLTRRDPAFGANAELSIATLAQIRAQLDNQSLLVITSLPDHLMQTRVDSDTATAYADALPRDELATTIRHFRETIQNEADVADAAGVQLSGLVLSKFGTTGLPARLALVVDGPLVSLPFGALPLIANEQRSYLGVHTALSVLPSLTLLTSANANNRSSGDRAFLGIGDARYSADAAQTTLGFVPEELRETNAELRFMAALLDADVARDLLTGPTATEEQIRQLSRSGDLAKYRILAFATHGFIGQQGRLTEAGLLLSEPELIEGQNDGVLSASEIYRLRFDADLVILSACDTGAASGASRGLSDLSQAFTFAGVRSLVVTHWEIDTHAAIEISRRIATEMRQSPDVTAAETLRRVIQSLINTSEAARFHHPKFWASHTVIGI
jgi:CHAT domain-containing protein